MRRHDTLIEIDIIPKIRDLCAENERLRAAIHQLETDSVRATKFYPSPLNVEAVASLHGVSKQTVLKYVALGLIPRHPDSTDHKVLIRASIALLLDFSTLRKESQR